ncbi:MAG TPA: PaaI family thioesterase [Polyangia bacterium]|nr:PaaI family thioesterase [Polyangia bacterium]
MPVPPRELLEFIQNVIPFNRFLGIQIADARDGFVRLELPFRPEYIGDQARPALHGGVISTLIDTAGGFAVWTKIELEDRVSTIDLRVDYLAPASAQDALVAEATVVRVGNRVGVTDVRCFQAASPERVVATGKAVYNIKRKEDA